MLPKPLKKTFTPIGDMIAIQVFKVTEDLTAKGIQMPDGTTWNSPRSRVIAVGPDVKQAKEGDIILTTANTIAHKVVHRSQECLVISEKHVVGVEIPEEE